MARDKIIACPAHEDRSCYLEEGVGGLLCFSLSDTDFSQLISTEQMPEVAKLFRTDSDLGEAQQRIVSVDESGRGGREGRGERGGGGEGGAGGREGSYVGGIDAEAVNPVPGHQPPPPSARGLESNEKASRPQGTHACATTRYVKSKCFPVIPCSASRLFLCLHALTFTLCHARTFTLEQVHTHSLPHPPLH